MLKWLSGILTTVLSGWILHDRLHHRLRSWSWYFLNSDISQGSVVTQLRCGEIISQGFVANLLLNLSVKEVWKSVNIWRSYGQYCSALLFDSHCSLCYGLYESKGSGCNLEMFTVPAWIIADTTECKNSSGDEIANVKFYAVRSGSYPNSVK